MNHYAIRRNDMFLVHDESHGPRFSPNHIDAWWLPTRVVADAKAEEVCGAVVEMDLKNGWRVPE